MECECHEDGFCKRYQREMVGRLREICRGEKISKFKAAKYRALWSGSPQPQKKSPPKCSHLGEPVRDESGDGIKKACAPCGGKNRQAFLCSHPETAEQVTLGDCAVCPFRPT